MERGRFKSRNFTISWTDVMFARREIRENLIYD